MIPEEKSASVARALREAFGVSEFEEIRRITKGLSSDLVFRIVVHGAPFLLRVATRIDERNDPKRQFACMKTAAEAGIAPRVLYVNAAQYPLLPLSSYTRIGASGRFSHRCALQPAIEMELRARRCGTQGPN